MCAAASSTSNLSVLVTGASGYLASHVVQQLLKQGYRVKGTVRSLQNEKKVQPLRELGKNADDRLELVEADLTEKECWTKAVEGCTYVCHIASPFPNNVPKNEMELITPAVEGTRSVLEACAKSGCVKRVVLTSSVVAIGDESCQVKGIEYTEKDWNDASKAKPYPKSKVLAEKAAWDFVNNLSDTEKFELVTMNPGYIQGPILRGAHCTSLEVVTQLLLRKMPLVPNFSLSIVDVRDAAAAHITAMTAPKAPGNRYILVSRKANMSEIASILSKEFGPQGYRVPMRRAPKFLLRLAAITDPAVKLILPQIGAAVTFVNKKAVDDLNASFRPIEETMIEMGYSAIERGFVNKTPNYKGRDEN